MRRILIAAIASAFVTTTPIIPAVAQNAKTCEACIAKCKKLGGRTVYCPQYCQTHGKC